MTRGHWLKGWNDAGERVVLYVTTTGQRFAWEPQTGPQASWKAIDCGWGTPSSHPDSPPQVYDAPGELTDWARGHVS